MADSGQKLTPMMRQYLDVKEGLPEETILLFRMGDFYELFFEDAAEGAKILGITLTKRSGIPMAGIPYHALANYLPKVLEAGVKVAIAEQMEDPKQAKGIVRREVTKIITPGTIVEDNILSDKKSNFILAVCRGKKKIGISCLDLSTGDFRLTQVSSLRELEIEIHRLNPAECLISESYLKSLNDENFDLPLNLTISKIDDWQYDFEYCETNLKKHFNVSTLDGFGCRGMKEAISASGVIFYYIQSVMRRKTNHITNLSVFTQDDCMTLDKISQRNLEIVEPIFKDSKGSTLLSVLDDCVTPMGSRLLREWLLRPLIKKKRIEERLDSIECFVNDQITTLELREALQNVKDIERIITRLNQGSANAREVLTLNRALEAIPGILNILHYIDCKLIRDLKVTIHDFSGLNDVIEKAIHEEPPITIKDGGIIRDGYNDDLDKLRQGSSKGKEWLLKFEADEKVRTGIKTLKVRYNKVFGYYIEISKGQVQHVPENYMRKQTLVNAERFITPELKEIENSVLGSEDKSRALEYELFQEIRTQIVEHTSKIQESAKALAAIDVLCNMASIAISKNYKRPKLNTENIIDITEGRHPVVDNLLGSDSFIPNDTQMTPGENHMHIITGPNMAGKSTYIRQVALLTLMSQAGSFIPCEEANIGIMESIFTRIGAADDLSRGQSTFMVEMTETANILNNTSENSLVILDEIGRGTSTFDGLSLAWAIAEFLHSKKSLTLFATHYHELTELSLTQKGIANFNVAVKEWDEKIIFLHKILPGGTDKSYGIYVARLAGLPSSVIDRSKEVLNNLEGSAVSNTGQPSIAKKNNSRKKKNEVNEQQPSLFDWQNS
ncbi:MAG: DNA mismatch repair protein MutS [Lentisphaeraceae bacterium]|nr:DNA mismatch repair protein MutS [Lentisphaeraceae bacterium]